MKRTELYQKNEARQTRTMTSPDSMRRALAQIRESVLSDYADSTGEHTRLLRLALNEAEALAWQTGFPHLFFPTLAVEKARSALAWHQRQRALRAHQLEIAFAE